MLVKTAATMLFNPVKATFRRAVTQQTSSRLPSATTRCALTSRSTSSTNMICSSTIIGGGNDIRAFSAVTSSAGPDITKEEVRALFSLWNNALATGDSRTVASRYANESILLPTISDTPRNDQAGLIDYFDTFLLGKPQGVILDGDIRIGDGWCQDAGIYEFTMGATGAKVKARYTYTYIYEDDEWKIAHHHSSFMPEEVDIATPITKEEVQGLFHLWNDALATLDSTAVAKLYAKEGILLPTISDTPRNDFDSIKEYFDVFLEGKPQGVILESYVTIGTNWCQDAGIYEFTMGTTGDKVKARYTFVYTREDGEWKISHHHSSQMPEEIVPKASLET